MSLLQQNGKPIEAERENESVLDVGSEVNETNARMRLVCVSGETVFGRRSGREFVHVSTES